MPISPCIYMMRDGGGNEAEDVSWRNVEDAPIAVEHGESDGGGLDPEIVTTSEGECVIIPRGAPEPRTPAPAMVARHNLTHLPYIRCLVPALCCGPPCQ